MANQSIISIPPNIEDPTVLRRTLSRIVEQLDTVYGKRTGEDSAYVTQAELASTRADLEQAVTNASGDATLTNEELSASVATLEDALNQVEADVATLTQSVADLDLRVTAIEDDYITEAPQDGSLYGRQNGAWVVIP